MASDPERDLRPALTEEARRTIDDLNNLAGTLTPEGPLPRRGGNPASEPCESEPEAGLAFGEPWTFGRDSRNAGDRGT